jgi:predicted dehydrogenase
VPEFPESLPGSRIPDPRSAPALRWGILGPGHIARAFAFATHTHTRQQLVAVGSRTLDRAAAFAQSYGIERAYGSYEQLVDDPMVDVVYVCTPHAYHREHALLAIAAGKPVLVEKAFTQNAKQAEQVFAAGRQAGVAVQEAMWSRFLPHFDVVRQVLADGLLGDVIALTADHGSFFPFDPEHRLYNPNLAGGALLDVGIYPISFASFVQGAPEHIAAFGRKTVTGVDGIVSAVLISPDGVHAQIGTGLFAKTPTTATVSGTAARLEIPADFYKPQPVRVIHRDRRELTWDVNPYPGHEGLAFEIAEMARVVAEGQLESPLMPASETVSILKTVDEIRRQLDVVLPGD